MSAGRSETLAVTVQRHMPLVHSTVRRHCQGSLHGHYTYEDAVQAGTIGLMRAIEEHDPERGAFSTCAVMWIRAYVGRDAGAFHGASYRAHVDRRQGPWHSALPLDAPISDVWAGSLGEQLAEVLPEPGAPECCRDPRLPLVLSALNEKDKVAVLEHPEIAADLLGQPVPTVQRRRFRAIHKARKALGVAL